jgi:MoxR-like ATPase
LECTIAVQDVQQLVERIAANVEQAVVGKREAVRLTLAALLCNGHVLIEDVPGVGKTVLAKAVARSIGASFRRIQCTPDLLPSDVTGAMIFDQRERAFVFRPGPLVAQVVLADEINRATPRTQSAMLESMEEGQVTVDGETYALPRPFVVLATQNPIEFEGTFPLPEAQLDRFLVSIALGYPNVEEELAILEGQGAEHPGRAHPLDAVGPVAEVDEVLRAQEQVRSVYVDPAVRRYVVEVVRQTRTSPAVRLGASPRGSLAVFHLAQAWAALAGQAYVTPDDVKAVAPAALAHRLLGRAWAEPGEFVGRQVVSEILGQVPVPGQVGSPLR